MTSCEQLLRDRAGSRRIGRLLIYALPVLFLGLACLPSAAQSRRQRTIRIRLEHPADSLHIYAAPLRYDKDFAFSFTLDDGLVSAYLVAFPFFSGGKVASAYVGSWGSDQGADGNAYPGLFYSDGCGNPEAFRAAIAINAKSIGAASGWLDWKQVKGLYDAGWDVLNHGFAHATGGEVDAVFQARHNNEVVRQQTGIVMKDFVIPGGAGDTLSDGPYTRAAFSLGMETVQCEHFGKGFTLLPVPPPASGLKLGRFFLHTSAAGGITGDSLLLASISSGLSRGRRFWINAFTHSVGGDNLWHISLVFPLFRAFFQQLEASYGLKGSDDMWMAPTQEVCEYLITRERTVCSVRRRGKTATVTILDNTPRGLRRHELTLVVKGARIRRVKGRGCHVESYGGAGAKQLINVDW